MKKNSKKQKLNPKKIKRLIKNASKIQIVCDIPIVEIPFPNDSDNYKSMMGKTDTIKFINNIQNALSIMTTKTQDSQVLTIINRGKDQLSDRRKELEQQIASELLQFFLQEHVYK